MSIDLQTFGLQKLFISHARSLYNDRKNIYIKIFFHHTDLNELKELDLMLLDKDFLDVDYDTKSLFDTLTETNYTNKNISLRKKSFLKDRAFKNAVNQIIVKHVFPYPIMDTFYYTDNKTTIPKEYEKEILLYAVQTTIEF